MPTSPVAAHRGQDPEEDHAGRERDHPELENEGVRDLGGGQHDRGSQACPQTVQ